MREVVLQAAGRSTPQNTSGKSFERLSHMSAERIPGAQRLVQTVKDLLTRDEHVVSLLARGLQEAQLEAFTMLTDAVEPATRAAPRLLSRTPVCAAPGSTA